LVGNPQQKRPVERPRHKWEDNIKMYLRKIMCEGCGIVQTGSRLDPVVGFFEHGNKPMSSVKGKVLFD
jgi:hypothetical protein